MRQSSRRLGELLVERKVLSRDTLAYYLVKEQNERTPLAVLLARDQVVSERDLLAVVAAEAGHRFVDLTTSVVDPKAVAMLDKEVALSVKALPICFEGGQLLVAVMDPTDQAVVRVLEEAVSVPVVPALAHKRDLEEALVQIYEPEPEPAPPLQVVGEDQGGSLGVWETSEPAPAGLSAPEEPPHAPPEAPAEQGQAEAFSFVSREQVASYPRSVLDFEPRGDLSVDELLTEVVAMGGSDLHLSAGRPPSARVDGTIVTLSQYPVLNGSEIRRMIYAILSQKQRERFENELELDTSYAIPGVGRFRVNVFFQRDSVGAAMRVIPTEVVEFDRLGLPPVVASFADLPRGLILVTGPTGSGKSTTLAALVHRINTSRAVHIMTVEDPIEFLHHHHMAIVNQREVGEDTKSFAAALRHVLRQDPDVILVGEMRDLETIATALTAAETGHLVLGTLHTQDAPQSVDRIIDVFPASQQAQIRIQLASTLQGIVSQQLVPLATGRGRAVAAEVLVATPAIRNLIREGKSHQIYTAMQAGRQFGMQTMDGSLASLVAKGKITMEVALERCVNPDELRRLLSEPAA